jgi:hypothetical protein
VTITIYTLANPGGGGWKREGEERREGGEKVGRREGAPCP